MKKLYEEVVGGGGEGYAASRKDPSALLAKRSSSLSPVPYLSGDLCSGEGWRLNNVCLSDGQRVEGIVDVGFSLGVPPGVERVVVYSNDLRNVVGFDGRQVSLEALGVEVHGLQAFEGLQVLLDFKARGFVWLEEGGLSFGS